MKFTPQVYFVIVILKGLGYFQELENPKEATKSHIRRAVAEFLQKVEESKDNGDDNFVLMKALDSMGFPVPSLMYSHDSFGDRAIQSLGLFMVVAEEQANA